MDPWATSGLDLLLPVDRARVRASLEDGLRGAVRSGRLAPGTVLPSSRTLARDLEVARNTVADVYGQLVAEGWLNARGGSRTIVGDRARAQPVSTPDVVNEYPVPAPYDLRSGWPDLTSFPRQEWLSATRRALNAAPPEAFGYQEPRGRPELRRALAEYLSRARGVRVDADQVVVCLGAMHGLHLIGKALRARGATTWATESHGLHVHREAAAAQGFDVRIIPVDADGAEVHLLGDADAVLLTPTHQFPLGVALSSQRRRDLIEWSRSPSGGVVIEDDYDGEFRYDRRPVGALQALAPDRVVYTGTVSKSLAPGLRLGWLVVPPDLLGPVIAAKTLSDGHSSVVDQLTLAALIDSGAYDRHVRRSRLRYRLRRDQLIVALAPFDRFRVNGISAGLHALVTLPPGMRERDVINRGRDNGVTLQGLATYAAGDAPAEPALVIGYGTPPDHRYPDCLSRLSKTLTEVCA